ncbi:MAG: hypothetical protein LBM13_02365 [Candidatus Ancillula sp.]|jgi:O-antigen/teichoic acid export membrane protein|nr:hypothetical protein [Candidatus Ancillula sp.]
MASRTKNAAKSALVGGAGQALTLLCKFLTRGLFVYYLGKTNVGLNQQFTELIGIFSLAELGLTQAIDYHMFASLAKKNNGLTKTLLNLYRKIYAGVALFIVLVGIVVTFLMPLILKDNITAPNVYLIWWLFVAIALAGYLLRGKRPILMADQRQDIIYGVDSATNILTTLVQLVSLFLFKSFIIYLVVALILQLLSNCYLMYRANKLYGHIDNAEAIPLSNQQKTDIKKLTVGTLINHLSTAFRTGLDNTLLTTLACLAQTALYSNYFMINNAITQLFVKISNSIIPAVGNLNVQEDEEKKYEIFQKLFFTTFLVALFFTPAFFVCITPFVRLWLGDDWTIGIAAVIALSLNLLVSILFNCLTVYQVALGLQWQMRISFISEALISIIISIIGLTVFHWGIFAIAISTVISGAATTYWYLPHLIYKDYFKVQLRYYFFRAAEYIGVIILACIVVYFISLGIVPALGKWAVFALAPLSLIVSGIFTLFYSKTNRFKSLLQQIKNR